MNTKEFLKQLSHDEVVAAIRQAEQKTSGEIRVFVSHKKVKDPVEAAQLQFRRLGMTQTRHRNGVLIFVAPVVRKFAVVGDREVHRQCGEAFWQELALEMTHHFQQANFTLGLVHGVSKAGQLLARHFPAGPDDRNELPDTVEHD